jgi:uncharacterized protein involved in exopolysaccharide biosynthesis
MDNGNSPATKQDIEQLRSEMKELRSGTKQDIEQLRSETKELRSEMKQDIEQLRSETKELRSEMKQDIEQLRSETNHQYNDLVERITDAETRLLKAFYNFGQTNSKRMTAVEDNEAAIRSRLGILEDRVMEVEKRLNMPPAA